MRVFLSAKSLLLEFVGTYKRVKDPSISNILALAYAA